MSSNRRRYRHLAATVELPRARSKRRMRVLLVISMLVSIAALVATYILLMKMHRH